MSTFSYSQVFGDDGSDENSTSEEDVISAVEFDESGEHLAVGDKGGRIVLFQKMYDENMVPITMAPYGSNIPSEAEYAFHIEFQSHEQEFDYLKSLEIEEKINKIKWCKPTCNALFLLATNDKTIKLWKVHEKKMKRVAEDEGESTLFPKSRVYDSQWTATPRRIYANGHAYHINSISLNNDGETYLSSDDLRVNIWHMDVTGSAYNIVDLKPDDMENLSEVITSATFHPEHCHLFMYSSSRGTIKLGDMRQAALCDNHAKMYSEEEDEGRQTFFSEVLASISDVKFSPCSRYILSRDFMTLKLWDVNMEREPVRTYRIHDHLRPKLCELYENDQIFDKFECSFNKDGTKLCTGTYSNTFFLFDRDGNNHQKVVCNRSHANHGSLEDSNGNNYGATIDYKRKVLHHGFHPSKDILSVGAYNNLYIYKGDDIL